MPHIYRLSQHLINQIAAGEVIENPASVVKELVDNSLDAGSTKITVETKGGGLQSIRISDNGCGMGPEDAVLCFERHATSKIQEMEDLMAVLTMGFRGEALASIASISKMTLQTATDAGIGTQVEIEGGVIQSVKPCARNPGTTIEVRQLFYNVPARRKFQKSEGQCSAEITKVFSQLSLANPKIGFELYPHNQEGISLPWEEGEVFLELFQKRVKKVLGEGFLEGSFSVDFTVSPFACQGIIGGVQNTRPTRALQYAFINRRPVLCPALSYAVKDAMGTRLGVDRFPLYALHVQVPGDFLDVNVHPQKKEIRLREEKWMQKKLQEQIEQALFSRETVFDFKEETSPLLQEPVSFQYFSPESFFQKAAPSPSLLVDREQKTCTMQPLVAEQSIAMHSIEEQRAFALEMKVHPIGLYEHFLWVDAKSARYLPLGIDSDGVLVVDLKAAGSRILFESLQREDKLQSQALLLPLSFSCSLAEAEEIAEGLLLLQKMGFFLRPIGKQAFLVEAIPRQLQEEEALDFLRQFTSTEKEEESWRRQRERKLATVCARRAARYGRNYTLLSGLELLYELAKTTSPLFCPLGNKTIICIGNDELQKLFFKCK